LHQLLLLYEYIAY